MEQNTLTPEQTEYLALEVNEAGAGKYTFVFGKPTKGKLGVVVEWTSGDLHVHNVSAGNNHLWLSDRAQFANVVAEAVKALKRPFP